ncbi:uncharacterized protein LOC127751688 [Frankliniella occidentalis]|uniref:Uncharacterized protein LOC127751688 n=1 Tax=Frankliniella occidentalis TaxID=133901 RepID=A0A9C6XUI1_FRAOC|nr:uncharacterized protein LOC127751688 [Frankliniella occidentalis]
MMLEKQLLRVRAALNGRFHCGRVRPRGPAACQRKGSWGRSASRHSGDSEPGPGDAEEATGDPTTPTGSKSGSGTEGDAADEQGPPPSARPSRAGSQGAARGAAGAAKTGAQTPTGTRPPLDAVLRLKQGVAVEDMAAETNEDESATRLTKRMVSM